MKSEGFAGRASGSQVARTERLLEYVVGLLGVTVMVLVLQPFFALTKP